MSSIPQRRFRSAENLRENVGTRVPVPVPRRYWRVFSIAPGDVVVETGAIDTPACASVPVYEATLFGCKNYWGYYLFDGQQTKIWAQELQFMSARI